ncbi:MAG: 6-bladed beta-propeller [Bacteroidaceae bacterium]|nr:6-bladed beta-propeller [Bacteroidaceae bacterium]
MNPLKNLSLCMMACIGMAACTSKQPQEAIPDNLPYTVIPFEKGVENEKQVKLSEIAEKITFIPMETTDASLLTKVRANNIISVNGTIVIPCFYLGAWTFDKNGKFIAPISRKGQGPGEFTRFLSVAGNSDRNLIYVKSSRKMIAFRPDGTFVNEYKVPGIGLPWEYSIIMQDSITLSNIINATGQSQYRLILSNTQGDTLKAFPQYDRFEMPYGMNYAYCNNKENYLYQYKGESVYHDYYCDTLYTVTRDSLLPRYLLDMGKYKLPKNMRLEVAVVSRDYEEYLMIEKAEAYFRPTFFENDRYIVMPYTTWNLQDKRAPAKLMYYDRETKECIKVKDDAFVNDMMGDLPFHPDARVAENILGEWWEATELMELAEEGVELPDNLKNLKEDDNGVLVLVHLKK